MTGCSTTQVHSSSKQHILKLEAGDLACDGVAFLTPSTVTGKEEDKQTFALVFTETLQAKRPDIRFKSLPHTLCSINRANLANDDKQMVIDYRVTGIFNRETLARIGEATDTRYIAQLKLSYFLQYSKGRFSAMGIRLFETKQAHVRLFLQIWDAQNGAISWEAVEELNFAYDTSTEDPVSFNLIVKEAAGNMIDKLP
ncbi:hypothetical protein [Solemya velesiana gill symbiont]|uniref:Lipoprotein n=1 Tax=Solemya velesiana gill symbiont TaxID=1918948 RepID=A0A1T2KSY2_9GAMM|nr:hypothetical protein [Solemya velesiana gill symbiont]OOZ35922.1 hypothetical protein BOW51_09695 [Solemya velesiana gill symbiont]